MDNYSLSDLATVTKDGDGWGGNGGCNGGNSCDCC